MASWLGAAAGGALAVFGIRTVEQPRHEVVDRLGPVEVRRYAARVAAEAAMRSGAGGAAREAAFRALFRYISGANRPRRAVAMTAPVEVAGGTMRFFLPEDVARTSAPEPADPAVRIVRLPEATLAVLRFTGWAGPAALAARRAELLRVVEDSRWRATAEAFAQFYDPPFAVPFLRRNEVAVAVTPR